MGRIREFQAGFVVIRVPKRGLDVKSIQPAFEWGLQFPHPVQTHLRASESSDFRDSYAIDEKTELRTEKRDKSLLAFGLGTSAVFPAD